MERLYPKSGQADCINQIFRGEYYHYLVVRGVSKGEARMCVCVFNGGIIKTVDGKSISVAEMLADYIEKHGHFYLGQTTLPRHGKTFRRLEVVLYSFYHSKEVETICTRDIRVLRRKCVEDKEAYLCCLHDEDEKNLLVQGSDIDFTLGNIVDKKDPNRAAYCALIRATDPRYRAYEANLLRGVLLKRESNVTVKLLEGKSG